MAAVLARDEARPRGAERLDVLGRRSGAPGRRGGVRAPGGARRGVCVRAFLEGADGVYFTSSLDPCRVYRYGAGYGRDGLPASFAWTTGWLGGDSQRKRKDGFVIRFFAEGADGLCLRLAVQTERGRLERAVTLRPEGRTYRLRFPLRGVRFRLCLYGEDNRPWRIPGGLEVHTDDENLG